MYEILPRNTGRPGFGGQRFIHVLTSSQRAEGRRGAGRPAERRPEGWRSDVEPRSAAADQRLARRKTVAHVGAEEDRLATPLCDESAARPGYDSGRLSQGIE